MNTEQQSIIAYLRDRQKTEDVAGVLGAHSFGYVMAQTYFKNMFPLLSFAQIVDALDFFIKNPVTREKRRVRVVTVEVVFPGLDADGTGIVDALVYGGYTISQIAGSTVVAVEVDPAEVERDSGEYLTALNRARGIS